MAARTTGLEVEVVANPDGDALVSGLEAEVVGIPDGDALVTGVEVEVVGTLITARVSRVVAEVLHQDPDPAAQVSRVVTEVLHQNPDPLAQVSGVVVEVLQSQTELAAEARLAREAVLVGIDTDAAARLAREALLVGIDTPADARLAREALLVGVLLYAEEYVNLVKFELGDTSDPEVDFDHVLRVRMRKIADEHAGVVRIRLMQGDTVISTFEEDL